MAEVTMDMKSFLAQTRDASIRMSEVDPEYLKAYSAFVKEATKPGALSAKVKVLISVALSVTAQCPFCIAANVNHAIEQGATKQEIYEAGFVAGLVGGSPAIGHLRYLIDAYDQFTAK